MVCHVTETFMICVCTEEEIGKSYHGSKLTPAGEAFKRLMEYLRMLGEGK